MRLGVPHQHLRTFPLNVLCVHAALHQQAAVVSRVRRWDASCTSPHAKLLQGFQSPQPKLTWAWHAEANGDINRFSSSQYLIVEDGSADDTSCYDSEPESGDCDFREALTPSPYSKIAVVEISTGEAAVVNQHAGMPGRF